MEPEFFHACVDAASCWLELTALQPRYRRYGSRVYDALRETPEWLEETLANWSSWEWFKSEPVQQQLGRFMPTDHRLKGVVESALDFSPPGYRDWRNGREVGTWRTFATQLPQGRPQLRRFLLALPLDSLLLGLLPYDFQIIDVPLGFVGQGVIADRLVGRPANFNVLPRAELEEVLKYFQYVKDRSGGKSSYKKWTGFNQRAFILLKRNPVSPGVFRTFLQHVGIDKATYIHDVRPRL